MKCTILVLRQSGMRHSGRVILACAIVVCAIVARNPKKSGGGANILSQCSTLSLFSSCQLGCDSQNGDKWKQCLGRKTICTNCIQSNQPEISAACTGITSVPWKLYYSFIQLDRLDRQYEIQSMCTKRTI